MKFFNNFEIALIFLIKFFILPNEGAKILAIFPFPGRSQYIVVQPYLKTLAARGHEVTAISAFPQKTAVQNYRDIPVLEVLKYQGDVISFASVKRSKLEEIMGISWYYSTIVKEVLNNENVRTLLESPEEYFDLIIVETLQTDTLYGFAEHFKAPLIGVSSFGTDPYIDSLVSNISPMAYTPLPLGTFTERMSFRERLENMANNLLMIAHRELIHKPLHDKLYKEYFPNATKSLEEIRRNISLILLNQHYSLSFPRPYVTNMIDVGGFHIQHKLQPLTEDIETFIGSSPEAVIYFSMGSNIQSEHFPAEIRNMFLATFAALPYKVLWKFENPSLMEDKPANVFISNWFPQADILAHPKVKLFITHGGLLSLMESVYHSKPVLSIPVYFDQFLNANKAHVAGYGLTIKYLQLNHTILLASIKELMENSTYFEKAKLISQRYRDQPINPLDKAVYWTEYVLRHQGASFLRSPAEHLNYWQRTGLDCRAVIGGALVVLLTTTLVVLIALIKYCCKLKNMIRNKEKLI